METSKMRLPFSGREEPQELKRKAVQSDEKIYIVATSQANNCLNRTDPASLDSTDWTRNAYGGDWQEETYQKIKAMKDLYLHDLDDKHQKILGKLQQHVSLPQQPNNEELEKLKVFKNMLERFMAFLQIPKQSILANHKEKLGAYEKQIVNVINSSRQKPGAPHQPSLDSTDQTRNANGGDWQEEVYQKIKAMKDLYLHDLNDMHQKIFRKLQQRDSLPQQPRNEEFEKMKVFKNMLERFMAFLQIPKQSILANHKEKLGAYEKQIVNVINSNRWKLEALQQRKSSLDSTDQTRNENGGDWQEEVYQKIKAMKELYLHDLNDMHQKISAKLQQPDSIPQQPTIEQLEKLKVFKNMLERLMAFLQIPKQSIMANHKDKLRTYKKQIVKVINSNRRKPGINNNND